LEQLVFVKEDVRNMMEEVCHQNEMYVSIKE
jgi:hypothetical protein